MKIRIDSDEWYPVYSVRSDDKYGYEVEATPEQIDRWKAAEEAFSVAQQEMGELHETAEAVARAQAANDRAEKEAREKAERKRLADERRAAAATKERERASMWQQINESGGYVYDARGRRVGRVAPASPGVSTGAKIEPATE